jgi:ubiquitin carboxyl-terminal hydrolase 5/13
VDLSGLLTRRQQLDIPLILPSNDLLDFNINQLGQGLQPDESELPNESAAPLASAEPSLPEFNQGALEMLQSMGFPLVRCQKALLATGNESGEAAMEWLFGHMEDPDIDEPIQLGGGASAGYV